MTQHINTNQCASRQVLVLSAVNPTTNLVLVPILTNQDWSGGGCYLAHNSSFVVPMKPQISAPAKGMPNRFEFSMETMEYLRFDQSAALSPLQ